MNTMEIIQQLEEERDRLNAAISALTNATGKRRGRKRYLTAASRKRISDAMKKRWAERRKK